MNQTEKLDLAMNLNQIPKLHFPADTSMSYRCNWVAKRNLPRH